MSRALQIGEAKALVRELVKAVGGVEAAAVILHVSHQRVSQLQSPNCPDMMTLLQISTLECVAERAIVTGAAFRAVEGDGTTAPIAAAAVDAVTRTASTLRLVSDMDADGRRDLSEIAQVRRAAQENLHAAERLADAAAHLEPGRVA